MCKVVYVNSSYFCVSFFIFILNVINYMTIFQLAFSFVYNVFLP